jgi:hypothetical protein
MTRRRYWLTPLLLMSVGQWELAVAQQAETKGNCSPSLVYVQVKGNFTVNCGGQYRKELQSIASQLQKLRSEQHLTRAQVNALVEATNIMVGSVLTLQTIAADVKETKEGSKESARETRESLAHLESLLVDKLYP